MKEIKDKYMWIKSIEIIEKLSYPQNKSYCYTQLKNKNKTETLRN